VNIFNFCG